ncbi:hypothetical protein ACGTN6_14800 [Halomonas sp. THAF12]|uniref:hypothetical protein n=1 Tax=Halomonas sp. B23F22_10 TaxID=3459515 RepID=UPI00373E7ED6
MSQYQPLHRLEETTDRPAPETWPPLYMPAMPPLGAIRALEAWWQARRRRRHLRQNLHRLLACDDATLEDIGYRRGDIHRALRLPRTQDALDALHRGAARHHQEKTLS